MRTIRLSTVLGCGLVLLVVCLFAVSTDAVAQWRRGPGSGPVYFTPVSVELAQKALIEQDYLKPGSFEKGRLDTPTTKAIRRFQREHFIRISGKLDPDTMAVLTTDLSIDGGEPPEQRGSLELHERYAHLLQDGDGRTVRVARAKIVEVDEVEMAEEAEADRSAPVAAAAGATVASAAVTPVRQEEETVALTASTAVRDEDSASIEARMMPATGSPVALMQGVGALLMLTGAMFLLLGRRG